VKPKLPDDDIAQYLGTQTRLRRVEQVAEVTRAVGDVGSPAFGTGTGYAFDHYSPTEAPWAKVGFYRKDERVYLEGLITVTGSNPGPIGSTMFVLPDGYRPHASLIFDPNIEGTTPARVDVHADGTVVWNGDTTFTVGAFLSLSGISFRAL